MPQLEKIQEVLPSRRDEAHFCSGVSRLITPNLSNFQRDLHTLAATQEVPRHIRLHSRGSTRVLFQGNLFSLLCLDFQAEDRLTPRWHVGQPCGKASWESLVRKPRGKATDSLIHAKGSPTLLLQLGRKAHVHAPLETRTDSPGETPEVPQDPCQHWRGILMFQHRLHTRS